MPSLTSSKDTSPTYERILPDNDSDSFTSSSKRSFLRATAITVAPSFAKSKAICLPIPELAPVTTTLLFSNFM